MIDIVETNTTFEIKNDVEVLATIRFQDGAIKEVDEVNGCQVEDVLIVALARLNQLNKIKPCRENAIAITKLEETLMWLDKRTIDRIVRGVEGTNKD